MIENTNKSLCLCCIEQGASCKSSCCPQPIVCLGAHQQCCCIYAKSALPCNDSVPCEVGLCGGFIINKLETIMDYERDEKEKKEANAPVEAVIVTTSKMDRK